MKTRSIFPRESILWNLDWDLYEAKQRAANYFRYRWPVTRAFRLAAYSLKRFGVIQGGTDCDGMRYASGDVFWTRKAAGEALDWGYDGAEGRHSGEVVTGAEAREWSRDYEPDTRDRYAEAAGY